MRAIRHHIATTCADIQSAHALCWQGAPCAQLQIVSRRPGHDPAALVAHRWRNPGLDRVRTNA